MLLSKTLKNSPSGLFFSVYLLNAREINRATKNRESVKKHIRLEPAKNRRTVKNWAASAGQFRFIDIMATIKNT